MKIYFAILLVLLVTAVFAMFIAIIANITINCIGDTVESLEYVRRWLDEREEH